MRLIVVSDSHGRDQALEDILMKYPNADAYIHCGDIEADASSFPQFVTVQGNNDIFYDYPDHQILTLADHRIYITHSHQFMYSKRIPQLAAKAKEYNCDIVCFGHTHVAADETCDGVRVINPGSIWRSRDGRGPSYAVVDLLENGNVDVEFIFLPQKQKKSKFFW